MIEYIGRSLKGVGRGNNEDSVFAKVYKSGENDVFVAAVCDGMGGSDNGELSSRLIATRIESWFDQYCNVYIVSDMFAEELSEPIRALIRNVNNEINSICEGMGVNAGSTLTLLVLAFKRYFIVQCGDSRAYKLKSGKAERITVDHSKVMNQVILGEMTFGQAVASKEKNILTKCIGMGKNFEVDIYKGLFNDNEMFVLCSDGFHGGLDDSCLYDLFDDSFGIKKMVDNAIFDKIASGEKDDISVIAVKNNTIPIFHKDNRDTEQTAISKNEDMLSVVNLEDGRIYNGSCILENSNLESDPVSDNSSFTEKNVIIAAIAFVATIILSFVLIIVFTMLKNYKNITADSIEKNQSEKQSYVISEIVGSETTIGESSFDDIIVNSSSEETAEFLEITTAVSEIVSMSNTESYVTEGITEQYMQE